MPTEKQITAAQDAYRKHVSEHGVDGSTEAFAAALAAAEAAAWEPIETAPKDGTPILALFDYNNGEFEPLVVVFDAHEDKEYPWVTDSNSYPTLRLSYWRPLPTPPQESKQ